MKKILLCLLPLFFLLQAVAQDAPCTMENTVFKSGESLTYKLYFNWNFVWMSAGEVTFQVNEDEEEYHLTADGKSYRSYDWFYRVRDHYDTYISKENLLPRLSIKTLEEGDYRLYDHTTLDQENGMAISWRGKSEAVATRHENAIEGCMHDLLSILYYCRNIDFSNFAKGDQFPIKIFMDKTTYPLQIKYLGEEDSKHVKGKGKFKTIVFSPEVVAGEIFTEDAQMKIWVSNDQNQIPLLIESPLSFGSVKAVLKSYEGLKYDMTAKLD